MKRAATQLHGMEARILGNRVELHLGTEHLVFTPAEAYVVADLLVDAAEKLSKRGDRT